MKNRVNTWILLLGLFFLTAGIAAAKQPKCTNVSGRLVETLIDPLGAPNDQVGRVIGIATGVLNGAETAYIVAPPQFDPGTGTILAETINVFVTDAGDSLVTKGNAIFTPIPGTGNVQDTLTLDIQPDESTGKYYGATGTIVLEGIGFNLLPDAVPGETYFIFQYRGEICYASE